MASNEEPEATKAVLRQWRDFQATDPELAAAVGALRTAVGQLTPAERRLRYAELDLAMHEHVPYVTEGGLHDLRTTVARHHGIYAAELGLSPESQLPTGIDGWEGLLAAVQTSSGSASTTSPAEVAPQGQQRDEQLFHRQVRRSLMREARKEGVEPEEPAAPPPANLRSNTV